MGWEQRRSGRYYYRKRREGGRVVSEYVGAGDAAELLALFDSAERKERAQAREQKRRERERVEAIDGDLDRLAELASTLTQAVLIASGYHTHKRQWRKAR